MAKKEKTSDALTILHGHFVKDDPERKAQLEVERVNIQVARMIYDYRKEAGLTQKELAELVGTKQSVVSRLEDADYDGHSLTMLSRIADALRQKLTVVMTAKDPETGILRQAFHQCMQMLRRAHKLTVDELAKQAGIDRNEIVAMERNSGYRVTPLTLQKLSHFYDIPERRMAVLAGAIKDDSSGVLEHASKFAAQSESFADLTDSEKQVLDEFVSCLRVET